MTDATISEEFRRALFDETKFEKKLNLGCGVDYLSGWTNIDRNKLYLADYYIDIDKPSIYFPFKEGTFDLIYAAHILEHIFNLKELKAELTRILKPGGMIYVVSPDYLSPDAWGDDTHVRAFSSQSFLLDFWPGFVSSEVKKFIGMNEGLKQEVTWLCGTLKRGSD